METKVPVQGVVEQVQQILECEGSGLVLGCPDPDLRHPVLDSLSVTSFPLATCWSGLLAKLFWPSLVSHEHIQVLCDLAMQSGRMQVLPIQEPFLQCWHIQSLAAMPLERPGGMLGTLLLADTQAERFGRGEEHLLHAYLSIYSRHLEQVLWEQSLQFTQSQSGQTYAKRQPETLITSEFISIIGHELRAPLSIIKGYTALLQIYGGTTRPQDQDLTPDLQVHYLDIIMEQTGMLELLVNDLLDITRLQQGKLALDLGPVELEQFCQQIAQLGQLRADQQAKGKYQFSCKVASSLPPILADIDRLRQVLLNVVENAIKYSPDGGCIELTADLGESLASPGFNRSQGSAYVALTIRDQGVGIPSAQTRHLFRPFERLERPAIALIPGSGLGLYIAHQFVEAMGGRIEIESEQNHGTCIIILLPALATNELRTNEKQSQLHTENFNTMTVSPCTKSTSLL